MLRRDMRWGSSDDELTPPPRAYAQDYYYDSDEESPAAASPRRASTPATAARARSSVPSFRARGHRSPLSASGEGARLCDEGDLIFAGVGAGAIRDPVAAFERYLEAATRHAHVPAMARVARCYASGEGAPLDLSESSAWLERGAAAAEDADAVNLLGARREAGDPTRGESADESAAAALYRRAAELGSVEGARNHARALELGFGVAAPDPAGAAAWYEKAAAAGDADAQCALGALCQSGAADPDGVTDLEGAFRWFSAAAARGSADGLNALAMMHEDGPCRVARRIPRRPRRCTRARPIRDTRTRTITSGTCTRRWGNTRRRRGAFALPPMAATTTPCTTSARCTNPASGFEKTRARRGGCTPTRRSADTPRRRRRLRASRRESALDVAGDGDGDGDGDAASAASASLRRQLAAKEKETSRLAKELGESKAECGRLKSTVADLRGAIREHEKEAARLRAEASRPASPATGAGAGRRPSLRAARASPATNPTTPIIPACPGCRGSPGDRATEAPRRRRRRRRTRRNARRPAPSRTVSGASIKSAGARSSGALSSVFGKLTMGGAKRAEKRAAEKESLKAHNREVSSVRRELEAATSRAELHEEMSATLSEVLRATYARNLQLEELLRKVGVDPDDPAIECELTPIAVETVAGYDVSQLDAGREGVGPGENWERAPSEDIENETAPRTNRRGRGTRSRRCRRRGRETRGEETEDGTGSRAMDDRRRSDADDDPPNVKVFSSFPVLL